MRPTGLWRAVLVSSLLFGLGHLGNSVLRAISPIIAAQALAPAFRESVSRRFACAPTPDAIGLDLYSLSITLAWIALGRGMELKSEAHACGS